MNESGNVGGWGGRRDHPHTPKAPLCQHRTPRDLGDAVRVSLSSCSPSDFSSGASVLWSNSVSLRPPSSSLHVLLLVARWVCLERQQGCLAGPEDWQRSDKVPLSNSRPSVCCRRLRLVGGGSRNLRRISGFSHPQAWDSFVAQDTQTLSACCGALDRPFVTTPL